MTDQPRPTEHDGRIAFVCSCEDSMPLDDAALSRGCANQGTELRTAEQLCRAQLDRFMAALGEGRPVTVGCTQEAPLFTEEAEALGAPVPAFVNLRENAGWSTEAKRAGPKMAGLLAAAAVPAPPVALVPLTSEGVTLVLGRDAVALAVAERLAERLDLTVLLTGEQPVTPPRHAGFPVLRGRARGATGWLGAFEVVVDGYAAAAPSSRAAYAWGPGRDGARSRCDLILDLTGGPALFPAAETRQGYLRAHPEDPAAVERLIGEAAGLVGSFDKPRFIDFEAGLCAHSRNRRTGCTRCLDLCPTGAITPGQGEQKDHVVISPEICAGCGSCAAVCPTGAATYALPPPATTLARLRALLLGFAAAGGAASVAPMRAGPVLPMRAGPVLPMRAGPVLLLHDDGHGEALLDALARHGDGLPARVLPLKVNECSQLDLTTLAAGLAWGAVAVRVLLPARRPHGAEGLFRNLDYLQVALDGLGLAAGLPRAAAIETDDPFTLAEALAPALTLRPAAPAASFLALGSSREVLRSAFRALRPTGAPGSAPEVVPLPPAAPFGLARVATEGCTLCLACTMVCPTSAFSANPEAPELRFLEDACVQCGLCVATCPERVISLEPRLNFAAEATQPQVVKREDPALCTRCAKPFGTRSSIDRVKARLGAHWMFAEPGRLAVLEMCENCRAAASTEGNVDPYAGPARPVAKTTADWLAEREDGTG